MSELYYVYGACLCAHLQDGEQAIDLPAVDNPSARPFYHLIDDLALIISPIESEEILSLRRHLMAHTKVLEGLMRARTLLPMRFGLITSLEALERVVRREHDAFIQHLTALKGKAEYGIRVAWHREVAMNELAQGHPELKAQWNTLKDKSEEESYYQRIDLGQAVSSALEDKREAERERLAEALKARAERHVLHKPDDDMQVLKADFLIRYEDEEALFEALRTLVEAQEARVEVKFIGPVPPYNFVKLRLDDSPAAHAAE